MNDALGQPVSCTSAAAIEAYDRAIDHQLHAWTGGLEALDQALLIDPGFAVAHAARALVLQSQGRGPEAREAVAMSQTLGGTLSDRERSHIAVIADLLAGRSAAAMHAVTAHAANWPGDALVIRTGRYATRVVRHDDPEAADDHGNWCGLHVDCIDLIDRWDLSTVATDSSGDSFPSTTPHCSVPIHILTEVYLGLPLIHHLELETLAPAIHARGHADFMLVVAPLRITGATGSPVSPVAIL